ncbi:MAG: DUF6492 family protein [Rhodospirillum sp.]|nr:DUF6492 family protein [Rhodospirillum sp.]MCF8488113.1 DUF6492 family protein [Rhodospirillum sp.]MCF8501286.1 DUF6492 family protein [Rhodospirillum sp.]
MIDQSMTLTLITPSYRGDFPLFERLSKSVERHAGPGVLHMVIVPPDDIELFRTACHARTLLASTEDVIPARFHRVPTWLNPLRARQDLFIHPGLWIPVRGWILQQLVKFGAAIAAPTDSIAFVDSDVMFIRPVNEDSFKTPDGRLRLYYEKAVCGDLPSHQKWYEKTAKLLDLPSTDPFWGDNYINDLITWRRSHAQGTMDRVETVTGKPWWKALAASTTLSEYTLYGVYVTNALGGVDDQTPTDALLHHSSWYGDVHTDAGRAAFVEALSPDKVAVSIQSYEHLDVTVRNALLDALQARAIEQDAVRLTQGT